jgi:hypothetical protein
LVTERNPNFVTDVLIETLWFTYEERVQATQCNLVHCPVHEHQSSGNIHIQAEVKGRGDKEVPQGLRKIESTDFTENLILNLTKTLFLFSVTKRIKKKKWL